MENIGIIYFNSASTTPKMQQATNTRVINLHVFVGEDEITDNDIYHLYKVAEQQKQIPRTSQPSTGEIFLAVTEMLEQYQEILIMTPTTMLSGTHQNVVTTVEMLSTEQQERIHIIQTRSFALSELIITDYALTLIEQGKDIQTIINELEALAPRIETFIFPGDLNFLRKSGRVNLGQLLIGKMVNLKLMIRHVEPSADVFRKARGTKSLMKALEEVITKDDVQKIYLGNLGVKPEIYEQVKQLITKHNIELIDTKEASFLMGCHFGPNSFGLAVIHENIVQSN